MKKISKMVITVLLGLLSVQGLAAAKPSLIKQLDRFVAMDGACAWPQLTVLPNGEIAAVIWPYPNHGFNEGAAECWISSDGGARWRMTGVPVKNIPGVARLNVATGLNYAGAFVALIGGFGGKPSVADVATYKFPAVTPNAEMPIPSVSLDHGRTWKESLGSVFQQEDGKNLIPYGRIASLGNNELGVMCYRDDVVFYVSKDGGVSWQKRGVVSRGKVHNETTWLRLANGDLYAAARTWEDGHVDGLRSIDDGVTWKSEGAVALPRQHPADLTRLPDGRILLTYGLRNEGIWGVCVRFGDADARTWGEPVLLVNMEDATDLADGVLKKDGGYPSTVVLSNGTLVTAYYTKGTPAHRRYHVGIVRWNLVDPATPSQGRNAGN